MYTKAAGSSSSPCTRAARIRAARGSPPTSPRGHSRKPSPAQPRHAPCKKKKRTSRAASLVANADANRAREKRASHEGPPTLEHLSRASRAARQCCCGGDTPPHLPQGAPRPWFLNVAQARGYAPCTPARRATPGAHKSRSPPKPGAHTATQANRALRYPTPDLIGADRAAHIIGRYRSAAALAEKRGQRKTRRPVTRNYVRGARPTPIRESFRTTPMARAGVENGTSSATPARAIGVVLQLSRVLCETKTQSRTHRIRSGKSPGKNTRRFEIKSPERTAEKRGSRTRTVQTTTTTTGRGAGGLNRQSPKRTPRAKRHREAVENPTTTGRRVTDRAHYPLRFPARVGTLGKEPTARRDPSRIRNPPRS